MEITLEAIISLIGLFIGGTGIGGFFYWRQSKRKAEAEAKLAEAEAKLKEAEVEKAKIEAKKEDQDYYQQFFRLPPMKILFPWRSYIVFAKR